MNAVNAVVLEYEPFTFPLEKLGDAAAWRILQMLFHEQAMKIVEEIVT